MISRLYHYVILNVTTFIQSVATDLLQGTVSNAYNTGSVTGASYVGGLAGVTNTEGRIANAYNTGMVQGIFTL